jgi:small nuclear ribonucleoprotein (snRNP)-like protein
MSNLLKSENSLLELKKLLGSNIRIRISDGRLIEGEFQCVDKHMNFIIGNATEYHNHTDDNTALSKSSSSRALGMSVIPGNHVIKVMQENK